MNKEMISINPKYKNIIDYKLNDADSKRDFMFLVNLSIKTITQYDEISKYERFMYAKNREGLFYPSGFCVLGLTHQTGVKIAGQRLMKYVRAGLLTCVKGNPNYYFFPYDFFITNDLRIKFVIPANIVF